MKRNIFRGLDAKQFLRHHWQKRPLVVRNALPQYAARITRADLIELAARDEIESRIVARKRGRWSVDHGPFTRREIMRMPRADWTLLVQGADRANRAASELLREFSFIPYGRLDDVMVSFAAPGGGVGPHFDSYDVFLVQGSGARRWGVGRPREADLDPNAPLKILRRFEPDDQWLLEPGDVLYVPAHWPHHGEALGECVTYSVGFRAPSAQELACRFLDFLQDDLALTSVYADPNLTPTRTPARIDTAMSKRLAAMLRGIRWSRADEERFIGSYLSEPHPSVTFKRPQRPLTLRAFAAAVRKRGVELALATRMLYRGRWIFMNGETFEPQAGAGMLRALADNRALPPLALTPAVRQFIYDAYLAGYIELSHGI